MRKNHKHIKFALLSALLVLSGCGETNHSSDYFGNPTLDLSSLKSSLSTYSNSFNESQIPNQWPNYGIGDPFVYRYNGTYYLYPSTSSKGVRGYKSYDLMNWEPVTGEGLPYGYVLSPDDDTTVVAYAPEVIYSDGWFYLCQSQAGNGHYFYKSRSPEGPFLPYTGNVGESIDGSFFIDNDGQAYFLRAKLETIRMTKFNEDFTLSNQAFDLENTSMGGWTEGPYMLSRNGTYYLTFTGVHVGSAGYKVGYSYMNDATSAFDRDGFTRGDNVLINTDNEWHTLGHSSTTLGPDMDSHYIAYHSRSNGVHGRQFNLSRLLFNGSEMAVDRPSLTNTIVPSLPRFETHEPLLDLVEGEFLLSEEETKDTFTAEYNFIGANGKNIFSYVDDRNYMYVKFEENKLSINRVMSWADLPVETIDLGREYDPTVLHTIRLSYKDNLLDLYFDNMQKLNDHEITLTPGKIGYQGSSFTPYYTAFSDVGQGSSDQVYSKQQMIYANSYDETISSLASSTLEEVTSSSEDTTFNGKAGGGILKLRGQDHVANRIYVAEEGTYQLSLRVSKASLGKKIALKLDNQAPLEVTIPQVETDMPFVTVNIGTMDMSKGEHYLTLIRRQDIDFVSLKFDQTELQNQIFTHALTTIDDRFDIRGRGYTVNDDGLTSISDRSIAFVNKQGYDDVEVSVDLTFNGNSSFMSSGIVVRATNDAYGQWDDVNSLQGYYFGVKNTQAFLIRADYQAMSKQLAINFANVPSNTKVRLKVIADGNYLAFYIDDVLEFSVYDADAYQLGRVGLYTTGASTTFKNLSITPL